MSKFRTRCVPALLIYLACHRRQPLQRESLLGLLWPGLPQKSAQGNLRYTLYHLRQAIPEVADGGGQGAVPLLLADRQTVQINPDGCLELDVACFTRLTRAEASLAELEEGTTLYRGDFLADFSLPYSAASEEWAQAQRADLQRQALAALGRLTTLHLDAGDPEGAEKCARRQLAIDDFSEAAHRQLMMALFLAGQRPEALAHYELCHQRLQEELGIEPSAETQTLAREIRAGGPGQIALQAHRATLAQDNGPAPVPRHNLPQELTPFVGRTSELATLAEMLADPGNRLLTIVGPGGIGKTRLALAAAESSLNSPSPQFADGVVFVPLASLATADLIAQAIAEALHFRLDRGEGQLLGYLASKRLLLILDNFEHLLDGATLLTRILQLAPGVQLLTTSRERLQLHEEQLLPLYGLDFPGDDGEATADYGAVRLYLQTARRLRPEYRLAGSDLAHLARICRLVEGMPLALELAAGWSDALAPAAIAAAIEQGLDFLATAWRNVPARQSSIRAVFDVTWQRLSPAEQALFARLSVFRGGFTQAAAADVAGATPRDLAALVNKSLLRFRQSQGRYALHELLRQYAAEKLNEEAAAAAELCQRHSSYYCHWLSKQFEPGHLIAVGQKALLDLVQAEVENARAAWTWALDHGELATMRPVLEAVGCYYEWRGGAGEGRRAFDAILDRLATAETQPDQARLLRAQALNWQSYLAVTSISRELGFQLSAQSRRLLEDLEGAGLDTRREQAHCLLQLTYNDFWVPFAERRRRGLASLALFRELGDMLRTGHALAALARIERLTGDLEQAAQFSAEALGVLRRAGDELGVADTLTIAGDVAFMRNQYAEAEEHLRQSLAIAREYGHRQRQGLASGYLGLVHLYSGKMARALSRLTRCIADLHDWGEVGQVLPTWHYQLSFAYLHLGQYDEAIAAGQRARSLADKQNEVEILNQLLALAAAIDLARGRYDQARRQYQEAVAWPHRGVKQRLAGDDGAWVGLGLALLQLEQPQEARAHMAGALATAVSLQRQDFLLYALAGLSLLFAREGQVERAVALYTLAQRYGFVANSRCFEDVVGREIAALALELPADRAAAAVARGRELELWPLAAELSNEAW